MALPQTIQDIYDQVSAVDPNGDTMAGTLRISHSWPTIDFIDPSGKIGVIQVNPDNNNIYIGMNTNNIAGGIIIGTDTLQYYTNSTYHNIFHSGNFENFLNHIYLRFKDTVTGSGGTSHFDTLWYDIGIRQYSNALPDGMADNATYTYGAAISFPTNGARLDLWFNHQSSANSNGLWYRTGWNNDKKNWVKILDSLNFSNYALPLSGGRMTGGLIFSTANGIETRHIDGESTTFAGDLYLNYGVNAPIHVGHGGSHTISADGSYYSGTAAYANRATVATTATEVSSMPLITVTKSITLTTDWQDTGIAFNNVEGLSTGTYAVQVSGISSGISGLWGDIFSGIMSWYSGSTNGNSADEIILHSAGHSRTDNFLFLRILRHFGNSTNIKLQIKATANASSATNIIFKFRRLI